MLVDPYALKKVPFIPKDKIIHVSTILGPKQSKFGGQCEFTPDDLVKIQNMVATQYIIAEVTYGDIFEQSHITRFCEIIIHISGNVPGFDPRYLVAPVFGIVVPMSNAKRKMKSPTCHRKSSVSDRTHIPRK